MPRVTALQALPRERVAVELDGDAWRVLPAEAVVRARLSEGLELDRERLRTLGRELRRSEALRSARRVLRTRDVSTAALCARLERAGISRAAREEAVRTLSEAGIVDDARLARARVQALVERNLGDAAIRHRLERLRVDDRTIAEVLGEAAPEVERARRVVARRGPTPATARYLARRGFSAETVEDVVGTVLAEAVEPGYDREATSDIFPA